MNFLAKTKQKTKQKKQKHFDMSCSNLSKIDSIHPLTDTSP